jgi:hypothetical protein
MTRFKFLRVQREIHHAKIRLDLAVRYIIVVGIILMVFVSSAGADCVFWAQSKTDFIRLDSHTIILSGGFGPKILIKTYCYIYSSSELTVLKDSFCSYEDAVLYVDDEVCDVRSVQKLD